MSELEEIGTLPRRARLMAAAVRHLEDDPRAGTGAIGTPIGDEFGMEELVERLQPLFAAEPSLIRWVALRGALTFLDLAFTGQVEWRNAMLAMGLTVEQDPYSGEERVVLADRSNVMTPRQKSGITGLFHSLQARLADYDRIAEQSVQSVLSNPRWFINEAIALDYIAWASLALLRTGAAARIQGMAEPGRLDGAGWYTEPLFATAERYWDGRDWTARVRAREGRRWIEGPIPLA